MDRAGYEGCDGDAASEGALTEAALWTQTAQIGFKHSRRPIKAPACICGEHVTRQALGHVEVYKSQRGGMVGLGCLRCTPVVRRSTYVGGPWPQSRASSAAAAPLKFSTTHTAPLEVLLYIELCIVHNCAMSSGNPFRASLALNQAPSSPVPRTSFITETHRPEAGARLEADDADDGMQLRCVSNCPGSSRVMVTQCLFRRPGQRSTFA